MPWSKGTADCACRGHAHHLTRNMPQPQHKLPNTHATAPRKIRARVNGSSVCDPQAPGEDLTVIDWPRPLLQCVMDSGALRERFVCSGRERCSWPAQTKSFQFYLKCESPRRMPSHPGGHRATRRPPARCAAPRGRQSCNPARSIAVNAWRPTMQTQPIPLRTVSNVTG